MPERLHKGSEAVNGTGAVLFKGVHLFDGERFAEGPMDVAAAFGTILGVGRRLSPDGPAEQTLVEGGWLFPGFVDAHVHLSMSEAASVAAGSVTGVLDLGSPLPFAFAEHPPLRFATSGPLITARGGYPTRSWGANGYGLTVGTTDQARDAVTLLADGGATIIKLAIEPRGGPLLDMETMRAVTGAAHERGLKTAAHALDRESVRLALEAGADVLAHTPVERLPEDVIAALGEAGKTVISTVSAFGDSPDARRNLADLAAAGCPVAYGTDLGNGAIRPGIEGQELAILEAVLGGRERALRAATSVAGELAGLGGRITPDAPADLVWVQRFDSYEDLRRGSRVFLGAP